MTVVEKLVSKYVPQDKIQIQKPITDDQARVNCLNASLDSQCDNLYHASVMQPCEKVQRIRKQVAALQAELDELDRQESQQLSDLTLTSGQSTKEVRTLVSPSEASMPFDIGSII